LVVELHLAEGEDLAVGEGFDRLVYKAAGEPFEEDVFEGLVGLAGLLFGLLDDRVGDVQGDGFCHGWPLGADGLV
jgi:hypothetical protein